MSENIIKSLGDVVQSKRVFIDEPMSKHTSFQIGGPADVLVVPKNEYELQQIIQLCERQAVPVLIMGKGSNMLVSDVGIRGMVIKIGRDFSKVYMENDNLFVQSGVTLKSLSQSLLQHSLAGFEFAAGIPGTLGGALVMNAGAYGGEMKDILVSCRVMDYKGQVKELSCEEMELGYRSSRVQRTKEIVLSAKLQFKKGKYRQIKFIMEDYWQRRITKQPYYIPSGGSVFKRPDGYFAGKLIENCQLKGASIGGAMVSELHAGFIVNNGNATAEDVVRLMKLIQKKVKEKFDVDLEPELRVIGLS